MRRISLSLSALAIAWASLTAAPASAAIIVFDIPLNGAQEVLPNVGDPDGFGTAHLEINDATMTISWNIIVNSIVLPPTGAHIHQGAFGTNGPVRVDFNSMLSGSGLFDADLAGVLASPAGWYVNIHNSVHTGGAIRGQIPAPGAGALLLLGGAAAIRRRRV